MRRGVGDPVAGRVIAPNEDVAYDVLADLDIVVDSLRSESVTPKKGASTARVPLFPQVLEDALEEAGLRIRFDQMARHHEGQSVWVLDQDKIRLRVTQLVKEAIGDEKSRQDAKQRIAHVLEKLFAHRPNLGAAPAGEALDLKAEISRLAAAVERAVARMAMAPRGGGGGRAHGGNGQRRAAQDRTHDEVLLEIFQSNLELLRVAHQAAEAQE